MSVFSGLLPPSDGGAEFGLVMKAFPGLLAPGPWESVPAEAALPRDASPEPPEPSCPESPCTAARRSLPQLHVPGLLDELPPNGDDGSDFHSEKAGILRKKVHSEKAGNVLRKVPSKYNTFAAPSTTLQRHVRARARLRAEACGKKVLANVDPAVIEAAKYNYAIFHGVPVASVSVDSVACSCAGIDGWAGAWHEKIVYLVEASCGPEVAELQFSTVAGDLCSLFLSLDDPVDHLFNVLAREYEVEPYQLKLALPSSQDTVKYGAADMNVRTLLLEAYKAEIYVKALAIQTLSTAQESSEKTEDGRLSVRPDGRCGLRCVAHAVGMDAVNTALKAWDLHVNTSEGLDLLNGTDLATLIVLRNLRIAALSRLQQEIAVCHELRVIVDGCFPDGHFGTFDDWLAVMLTEDDSIHDYSNLWALGAGEVLFVALAFIFKARIVRSSYYPTGPCGLQQPSGRICDAAPVGLDCKECIHLAHLHNLQNEGVHFDLLRLSGLDPAKLPLPERLPQPPARPVRRTAPRSVRTF